ncbi:MAG: guanylate kinase [Bryobacteraceae bacterium]|nr:guanylate kinase [Bryobacteraceae bacterium]
MVFIISAPSGSGKSTLVAELMQKVPALRFSVSYSTRPPRDGERNGEQYHFVSRETFERMIANEEFLEWADVFGHYYGTHVNELSKARDGGYDLVLDIDVQGARQLREKVPDAVSIFILAPSRAELEQRLRARSQDSEAVIQRRLRDAAEEIRNYPHYDYVLVNDQVEKSAQRLISIVTAERARRNRMEAQVRPILDSFEKHEKEVHQNG